LDVLEGTHQGATGRTRRIGLQLKAVLILVAVVVTVVTVGGWAYLARCRAWARGRDMRHAGRMGQALALAARQDLQRGFDVGLQRLVNEAVAQENIRFAALLDTDGQVVATAGRGGATARRWAGLVALLPSVHDTRQVSPWAITLARPIVTRRPAGQGAELIGGLRLVVDTSATTAELARIQQRIALVGTAIVLAAVPLGYLMVWRVVIQPLRRLVTMARRLAQRDFGARAGRHRNDEIGELEEAFDSMAEEVARGRQALIEANEELERKVRERTAALEQTNQRLRAEVTEKEDFLRAVSHDLNAPLRNIAGMVQMLRRTEAAEWAAPARRRLDRIEANVKIENDLIAELLDLSRIKSRPQPRRRVDMGSLLGELAEAFRETLDARGIALEIAEGLPRLYVEERRIRQVFQNLIDNAIKYMDRRTGGRIRIGHERRDGMHVFHVADNGPGVPADSRESIFYVFRRAARTDAAVEGKGVGLAVVRTVAANYGGRAWVESRPGEGASFYVSLDVRQTQPPGEDPADAGEIDTRVPAGVGPVGR